MTSYAQEWQVDLEKARGTLQSLHGPGIERQVGRLARLVEDLEDRLVTMERKPIDYAVGQGELARRRVALDALRRDVNALGSARTPEGFPSALGGGGGGGGAVRSSRLEQQQETMREHDRMLEELSQGVGRLKTQSTLINEETSLHVRLLDDMEGDAATASAGLRSEARHAEKIRSKTKTFNLYVIIAVLTVILVILIFAGI